MGGEGGQGLGNGLLIPDVREHPAEDPHRAVRLGRDVQPTLGHQCNEAQGLEGHRLAAGVGTGDDQGVEPVSQLQVVGHRLLFIQQGVPRSPQPQVPFRQAGLAGLHLQGELSPGEDGVQQDQQGIVLPDILLMGGALGGQLRQDAFNLLFLPGRQLTQLVIGLHHPHGLNEEGGAAGGHVVDQAGDGVLVLRLHRYHVPVGADGNDGLLEVFGLVGGDQPLEDVPHPGLGGAHVPPDGGQLAAG